MSRQVLDWPPIKERMRRAEQSLDLQLFHVWTNGTWGTLATKETSEMTPFEALKAAYEGREQTMERAKVVKVNVNWNLWFNSDKNCFMYNESPFQYAWQTIFMTAATFKLHEPTPTPPQSPSAQ